jgi:hypothetical protein
MKNRIPFAALTAAFTIVGGAIGRAIHDAGNVVVVVGILAAIGDLAALASGDN